MANATFVARVSITTASSTDNITTAAFTTSGTNRAIAVCVGSRSSSGVVSAVSRGPDTFADSGTDKQVTSQLCHADLWWSSNEPATASTALTVTRSAAVTVWGANIVILSDVEPTGRFGGAVANTDTLIAGGLDDLTVASGASNNLVIDFFATLGNNGTPAADGSQTDRGGYIAGTFSNNIDSKVSTLPGTGSNVSMGWSGFASATYIAHIGFVANGTLATAPSATVPGAGICINIYGETAVSGDTVTKGTSPITAVATTCTAGATMTYDTTGTSVTLSGNGTNAVSLQNGASDTEYNTVLATRTMRGTTVDTTITVTVIPTDGTLNDNETFDVFCDPSSLTATGANADVIAWAASLQVRILTGQTNDTISVHIEDDTGTPIEVDSSFVAALAAYFQTGDGDLPLLASTRGLTDVIM